MYEVKYPSSETVQVFSSCCNSVSDFKLHRVYCASNMAAAEDEPLKHVGSS